jgi:predicted nucleotidyltransferase
MLANVDTPGERYSAERLVELRRRLEGGAELLGKQPLSVYVTGSYGRLEAWAESDIDLFFLHGGSDDEGPFPYTTFIRIAAELIDAAAAMKFPAFTGDGEYLEVHYVDKWSVSSAAARTII